MTDRDRLAADLHPWTCRNWETDHEPGQPAKHSLDFVACIPAADRLIALGWTRDVVGCDCKIVRECYDPTHGPLDEERLARALREAFLGGHGDGEAWDTRAAAIAKAYREDTE